MTDETQPDGELLEAVVPLLAKVTRRVGQTVTVQCLGGGEVLGTLVAVNDDTTVTIDDGSLEFDIPLHAIAVLEGPRMPRGTS